MYHATIRKSDISFCVGQSLVSVRVSEFVISLFFTEDMQLDIVSHWELVNPQTNALIDRAMSLKLRDQFSLLKLIGAKLTNCTKTTYQVELLFDNNLKLIVY